MEKSPPSLYDGAIANPAAIASVRITGASRSRVTAGMTNPFHVRLMNRLSLLFVGLLSMACVPALAGTLTIAVAANVQYAFDELQTAFRKESGHDLKPVYASSGKLTAQIMNGAPFDVFLSADMDYPEKLHKEGHATAAPKVYAYGTLVLWTLKDLDLAKWQSVLAGPAVTRIAVANPKTAPYGRETMKALTYFKLDTALKDKLVFGESISQTNQYIQSRTADAGFTAKSVVVSPEMKGQGKWIELPKESYQPIAQGIVVLKHGAKTNAAVAQQFQDFMLSTKSRTILERHGYLLP
ncbi:molybdate ABC transporter substrate-binding protein [Herbaspirillum sp. ST 5-3]|uniref:molybdate ABC transporter substrate-binding protein n=1 Tax=Oxalobacteraceae TaxID=75682 RepID=UPI001FFE3C3A|nr:molybdate ABC transporter substrate-binding protein [Herbaspirillum sp. ST 5-3]